MKASPSASSCPVAVAIGSLVSLHRWTHGPYVDQCCCHNSPDKEGNSSARDGIFLQNRGSRGSKKLLLASSQTQAFSHGWRNEAYEPQLNAAEVYDAGTPLLVAQAPPRWHWSGFPGPRSSELCCRPAGGKSSSVFPLRGTLVQKPSRFRGTQTFQEQLGSRSLSPASPDAASTA